MSGITNDCLRTTSRNFVRGDRCNVIRIDAVEEVGRLRTSVPADVEAEADQEVMALTEGLCILRNSPVSAEWVGHPIGRYICK